MNYTVLWERGYVYQQQAIEEDLHRLEAALQGLYAILRRNPYTGQRVPNTDIYAHRLKVFMGLLPLVVYYRIEEDSKLVFMLAIQAVDGE